MWWNFDFEPLFKFAFFGIICAIVLSLLGAGALVWFIITHVRVV